MLAVLVVVPLVRGVPVAAVQVVDVVTVLDRGVPAVGSVLVVVPLGPRVGSSSGPGHAGPHATLATRKAPTASSTIVPPDGVSA